MLMSDDVADLDALFAAPPRQWSPPSIDDEVTWGKYKGLTYRELAARDPAYAAWAAKHIQAVRGQLCAEALADRLGVNP